MDKVQDILTALAPVKPTTKSAAKAYDASIRQHVALLNSSATEISPIVLSRTKEILESLEPSLHTISYLFVLQILTESLKSDAQIPSKLIMDATTEFLLNFDPVQIRYAGKSLLALLDKIRSGKLFSTSAVVELLSATILRIDPTGSLFTSTHFMLARLAHDSNSVESALQVINRDILFYPNSMTAKENSVLCDPSLPPTSYISTQTGLTDQITTALVLEYNHIRGLMYMSRRDWIRAEEAFEQVVSHPIKDRGVSKIMVDSYKRWVLTSLLGHGKASPLHSQTPSAAAACYKVAAKAYDDVAETFMSIDAEKLKSSIEGQVSIWEEDGTLPLLQEVLSSYQKWQIAGLRHTHQRAEISMVREMTLNAETGKRLESDDDVLALIHQMMEDGMLNGLLEQDESGSYISFSEDVLTEKEFATQIAQSYQNIESISKQYEQMNHQLSSSREYVKYLAHEQKRAEKNCPDPGLGFDSQIEDEDLMSGITYRP